MWEAIKNAVESIASTNVSKVEGSGWKVYAVGSNVIRIDLENNSTRVGE